MSKINEAFLLRPWAMKREVLSAMAQIVRRHVEGVKLSQDEIAAVIPKDKPTSAGYQVVNGVARVPIYGVIAKHSNMVNGVSQPQGTSTEQIQKDLMAALQDPEVKQIALDIDSPGGSVSGVAELSDMIYEARGVKPITAFANGMMCSAAYFIGSSADKIYTTKSTEVGSIGVYTVLHDFSVWEHNEGIKTDIIKAGKFKAAGHPSKALSDEERDVIQTEINDHYNLFVDTIARNRNMSTDQVLELADGRVHIGKKSVDVGLADGVKTLDSYISSIAPVSKARASVGPGDQIQAGKEAKQTKQEEKMDKVKLMTEHKALADELIAEGKAAGLAEGKQLGFAEGKAAGLLEGKEAAKTEGANTERARVTAIIKASPPGMEKLACKAIEEGLTVEAAKDSFLKSVTASAVDTLGPGQDADPVKAAANTPEAWSEEFKKSADLQIEFGSEATYVAFKKAEKEGKCKILKK